MCLFTNKFAEIIILIDRVYQIFKSEIAVFKDRNVIIKCVLCGINASFNSDISFIYIKGLITYSYCVGREMKLFYYFHPESINIVRKIKGQDQNSLFIFQNMQRSITYHMSGLQSEFVYVPL